MSRKRSPNMARQSKRQKRELVFVPLGGVGEIGMNVYAYGYGPRHDRTWLIVDLGITFATEADQPARSKEGDSDG